MVLILLFIFDETQILKCFGENKIVRVLFTTKISKQLLIILTCLIKQLTDFD